MVHSNVFAGVSSFGQKCWKLVDLVGRDVKQEVVSLDSKIPSQTITLSVMLRFPGIPAN